MHFGEYLVKQKILSPHQILKALDEQRKRRAYIPLLLVEQGALPDYRALHMCSRADESNQDFLEVLVDEGLINQDQLLAIRAAWVRSGPPLGRLLVELGFMNETTLEEALDEFHAISKFKEMTSAIA